MKAEVNPILERRQTAPEHSIWWNNHHWHKSSLLAV